MSIDVVPLTPLERGQLHVLRLRALRSAALMLAVAAGVIFIGEFALPPYLAPWRWGALTLVPIALWILLVAPGREWRRCGYAFTGRELHVASGWWTRVYAIVPVERVQHIDVMQGPAERMLGVARLVLFMAGTNLGVVSLGGIGRDRAEEIRDAIRLRIGSAE